MKSRNTLVVFLMFLSFTLFSQKTASATTELTTSKNAFETFNPNENDRPSQFLTTYLRTHKRFGFSRLLKKLLVNPIGADDATNSMRATGEFASESTSITRIFLDNEEILGEGINRLYVIQDTRTEEIDRITRSSVGYDNKIHIYRKK
jgi:hypothetical protein